MWSAFQIRQDGVFTRSAQSFPSPKAPMKSWGLDPELPKALESLAGMRVVNSGSVTGRRIDGEKDVTSGSPRLFQFLLQM